MNLADKIFHSLEYYVVPRLPRSAFKTEVESSFYQPAMEGPAVL